MSLQPDPVPSGISFLFIHSRTAGLMLRLEVGIVCRLAHSHVQKRNVNCCSLSTVDVLYFAKVAVASFLVLHAFPEPWYLLIKKWGLYTFPWVLGRMGKECSDYSKMTEVLPDLTLEAGLEKGMWLSTCLSHSECSPLEAQATWRRHGWVFGQQSQQNPQQVTRISHQTCK